MAVPIHIEKERQRAVQKHQLIDAKTEKEFDGIVELVARVCDSPIALINLLDNNRQWIKAWDGIETYVANLDFSFRDQTLLSNDVMVVSDTLADYRFYNNVYVTSEPRIRFYAGVPLVTDSGHQLGTLCVMDRRPKSLNRQQLADLRMLAKQIMHVLELKLKNFQLQNVVMNKSTELSNFFDRIGDAFITLDKNWNYTFVNKRLGEMVHRNPEQLIGKNVWEEFPESINSATYHAFHNALKEQKYICHIDYYKPLDLWQENHIYPSSEGISVFIRDISARKRSEKQLIESVESLERAEEQAKMGSWQLDMVSGKKYWSKQLFLMFGFAPASEVPPREEILERVHPEDRAPYMMLVDKVLKGSDANELILRTNPLVLPLRYILVYTRQVKDENGKIIRVEGIMLDITELQKTNDELDHFVYSVSHDLRSPLATILGLLNVADLEKPDPAAVPHFMRIREQVNRLDYFIKEILDYSQNARANTQLDKIDFVELIANVKKILGSMTQSDRVQIELNVSDNHDFYSDKTRIEIILKNLISNSIKYQDMRKSVCSIKIKIDITSAEAKIICTDNGIGIEKIHLNKIFDMFYRATENAKGAGLGLYIVREAVHKLGGSIKVDSVLSSFTKFEITLPNFSIARQPL